MLNQYFNKIGKQFLVQDIEKEISIIYSGRQIFYDNEKIGNIFRENKNPRILVNDINNII